MKIYWKLRNDIPYRLTTVIIVIFSCWDIVINLNQQMDLKILASPKGVWQLPFLSVELKWWVLPLCVAMLHNLESTNIEFAHQLYELITQ